MSDEAVVGVERKDPSMDKWRPAIKAGLVLIAVVIVTGFFQIFMKIVLSNYLRPLWDFWLVFNTEIHPVYNAIFYLLNGVFLLALAVILVMNKGWIEALVDELQLTIGKKALNYLLIGLAIGAISTIAFGVASTSSSAYLFNELVFVGLKPEWLAMAVFLIVPLLIMSVGQVALVQGYFQRTISKNYGETAGLVVAVFIYMLLFHFPGISALLDSSSDPGLFLVIGTIVTGVFIDTIITGATVAYLFIRSKSVYMPIGFILGLQLFSYVFNGFVLSSGYNAGYSSYLVSSLLQAIIPLLVLVFVWYFFHDSPGGLEGLKSKLRNAVEFFRYHDDVE